MHLFKCTFGIDVTCSAQTCKMFILMSVLSQIIGAVTFGQKQFDRQAFGQQAFGQQAFGRQAFG